MFSYFGTRHPLLLHNEVPIFRYYCRPAHPIQRTARFFSALPATPSYSRGGYYYRATVLRVTCRHIRTPQHRADSSHCHSPYVPRHARYDRERIQPYKTRTPVRCPHIPAHRHPRTHVSCPRIPGQRTPAPASLLCRGTRTPPTFQRSSVPPQHPRLPALLQRLHPRSGPSLVRPTRPYYARPPRLRRQTT